MACLPLAQKGWRLPRVHCCCCWWLLLLLLLLLMSAECRRPHHQVPAGRTADGAVPLVDVLLLLQV